MWDCVQHSRHVPRSGVILNDKATRFQHHVNRVDDLVERGCCTTLLLESDQAEVSSLAMFKDSVELSCELDLSEMQTCVLSALDSRKSFGGSHLRFTSPTWP